MTIFAPISAISGPNADDFYHGLLGHETIETTHIYIQADLRMKERALEKLAPPDTATPRFQADDALLSFLSTL